MSSAGELAFWGHLLTENGAPTTVFTRLADSAFTYIIANHEPKDNRPTEVTLGKLSWLFDELGHVQSSIPIPLDHLAEFYRSFQIKFVMRQVDDVAGGSVRGPALLKSGWLQLLTICLLKDPDAAYSDLDQMVTQWELVDPSSSQIFPPVPREAAPPQAVPAYSARYQEFLDGLPPAVAFSSLSVSPNPTQLDNMVTSPPLSSNAPLVPAKTALPALESLEEREKFYGNLIDNGKVSDPFVRLQVVLSDVQLTAMEPTDTPADLWTPWKALLSKISSGEDLNEATRSCFTDSIKYYELFGLPYEIQTCKVSDVTKAQFPELAYFIQCCEGPQACFRYSGWKPEDWTRLAESFVSIGASGCPLINDAIICYRPIDPISNRYFPEIPKSCFLPEPTPECLAKLRVYLDSTQHKVWGDEPLVQEVGGRYQLSDNWERFLRVSFDYLLANAPPTTPSNYVTLLDYLWWCDKVDEVRSAQLSKDIELLDLRARTWSKWGIRFTSHEVTRGGKSYGVLPCLDFDNWCHCFAYDTVYDPDAMVQVVNAAVHRWPLIEPRTRLRYVNVDAPHLWPSPLPDDAPARVAVTQAVAEWQSAPAIYQELSGRAPPQVEVVAPQAEIVAQQAQTVAVTPQQQWVAPPVAHVPTGPSREEEAAERLRRMKEKEIKHRERNENILTVVKIIATFAGIGSA